MKTNQNTSEFTSKDHRVRRFCIISRTAAFQLTRVGGAETSMLQTAIQLANQGHVVFYVIDSEFPFNPEREKKLRQSNIHIRNLEIKKLRKLFNFLRVPSIYCYCKSLMLAFILRTYRLNLVYSYYEPTILNYLYLCKQRGLKFLWIMRMAGFYWYEDIKENNNKLTNYKQWFNSVDCVNFIHKNQKQHFIQRANEIGLFVSWKKEFVWDIGSDIQSVQFNYKYRSSLHDKTKIKLVSATRFSTYAKRQDILVRALTCDTLNVDLHLTLIGDGETKKNIEKLVLDLGISEKVTFMPFISQEELWDLLLRDCDIFCHPTEYEGLGKIVLEVLGLGIPVLASNVPVLNEVIEDEKNGFLVDNHSEFWAEKIQHLSINHEKRQNVSMNAKAEFGRIIYDPKHQIESFLSFLE